MLKKMTSSDLKGILKEIDPYALSSDEDCLMCSYKFKNWKDVVDFILQVSQCAEEMNHHPDICFGYGFCEVKIQTHTKGGITRLDVDLAKKINALFS